MSHSLNSLVTPGCPLKEGGKTLLWQEVENALDCEAGKKTPCAEQDYWSTSLWAMVRGARSALDQLVILNASSPQGRYWKLISF